MGMQAFDYEWKVCKWDNTIVTGRREYVCYDNGHGGTVCKWITIPGDSVVPELKGSYPISNPNVLLKSDDQTNSADFDVPATTDLKPGDAISIRCNDDVIDGFKTGIILSIDEKDDKTKHVYAVDPSYLLKNIHCKKEVSGVFENKIMIRNPTIQGNYLTLMEFASKRILDKFVGEWGSSLVYIPPNIIDNTIVYNSVGKVDFSGWGSSKVHPLKNTEYLPNMLVSDLSLYDAYVKLFRDICGMHIWYNGTIEGSLICDVDFGFIRSKYGDEQIHIDYGLTTLSSGILLYENTESIVTTKRVDNNKIRESIDEVIVYSNNNELKGHYIDTSVSFPSKTVIYEVKGNYGTDELNWMAQRIYTDRKYNDITYQVIFPPGTIRFRDGEYFGCNLAGTKYGIGDDTVEPPMEFRGGSDYDPRTNPGDSVWQINEVNITSESTVVTVGSSYITIFEMFKDKLVEVKRGTNPVIETRTYDSGAFTLCKGFHPNVLYENLILPGNCTGDITIQTALVKPVQEAGRAIPHEKVTKQFYFQVPSLTMQPNFEEYDITSGDEFTTFHEESKLGQWSYLYRVPYIEGVPAKYENAVIEVDYNISCRDDDGTGYQYCSEFATQLYYPYYCAISRMNELVSQVATIDVLVATVPPDTVFIQYTESNLFNLLDTIRDKSVEQLPWYDTLYTKMYDLTSLYVDLQNITFEDTHLSLLFGTVGMNVTYYADCYEDCYQTWASCDNLREHLDTLNAKLIEIDEKFDEIMSESCDSGEPPLCSDITLIEVDNCNPFQTLYRDYNKDPFDKTEIKKKDACDICLKMDRVFDSFVEFYESFDTYRLKLQEYCDLMFGRCNECEECKTESNTVLGDCQTLVSNCESAYTTGMVPWISKPDSLEKTKAIRELEKLRYNCINAATRHYMDCSKIVQRTEQIRCNEICDDITCNTYVRPLYKDLSTLCNDYMIDMGEFPTFAYDVYERRLLYEGARDFFYAYMTQGTTAYNTVHTYMSTHWGDFATINLTNRSTAVSTYIAMIASVYTPLLNYITDLITKERVKCQDDAIDFDINVLADFKLEDTLDWLDIDYDTVDLIESDKSHVHILNAEPFTNVNHKFYIKGWPGAVPIDHDGNIPKSALTLSFMNNSYKYEALIENIRVKVTFNYSSDAPFIAYDREYSELMIGETPTYPPAVIDKKTYPIYAYLSDYSENIAKVIAQVMRYDNNTTLYYQDNIVLDKIKEIGDIQVYKSNVSEYFSSDDKFYYDANGVDGRYSVHVVTPSVIGQDDMFRNIEVTSTGNPNDPDCMFRIHITPKYLKYLDYDGVPTDGSWIPGDVVAPHTYDEASTYKMSISDIYHSMDYIQFYNVISGEFSSLENEIILDVPRYIIEPVYYESLASTYKSSASIIPKRWNSKINIDEFPTVCFNKYAHERFLSTEEERTFHVFNNGQIVLSDNLTNAPEDGVRTRDVFMFGSDKINTMSIYSPDRFTYRFIISYDVYKNVMCDGEYENQ